MMKKISFLLSALIGILLFVACDKDDVSSPTTVDLTKTATLSGIVKANLDAANDTTANGFYALKMENAPSGTKLIIKVSLADYVLNPQGNYGFKLYETTIGSNGEYSVDIPTTEKGVDMVVIPGEFVYDQKQDNDGMKIRKAFKSPEFYVNKVIVGETRINDFSYQAL